MISKIIKVFISILLSVIPLSGYSQGQMPRYFNHYSIDKGLSQNSVNTIIQDRVGFIWVGTKDGLNRFDGFSFRIYKKEANNPHSLGNNYIKTLYEDRDGNIWVGTDAGLYIYDPHKEQFLSFNISSNLGTTIQKTVSSIDADEKYIWIAVEEQGIFRYNLENKTLTNYDLKNWNITSNIECIKIDKSGTIWLGSYGDGLFYSKDNMDTVFEFVDNNGNKIFEDDIISVITIGAYNCLYIGSVKGGLKELNLTSGRISELLLTDNRNENIYIRNILVYNDFELWLGAESGIYIYDLRTKKYSHITSSMYDKYALPDNAIYTLFKDSEEGVWIGSYFGGVSYYPKQYTYFEKYYPTNINNSLHGKRIREFFPDPDGTIWIGTEDGGLSNYNLQTQQISFFEPSKSFTNIQSVYADNRYLWVGAFSKGLKRIDKKTGAIKTYSKEDNPRSLPDNSVFAICKTSSGIMYIGTLFGLLKYNDDTDDFTPIKELDGKFVYNIKEDTFGNLWLGTYVNGVYCYDVSTKAWINYQYDEKSDNSLPSNKVTSIFEDSRNQIWITTQGGGFCLFDPEKKEFIRFDSQNGLPNDVIYKIVEDDSGLFWITSNKGLICFDPKSKHIKTYTVTDGILSDQFNYVSGLKATNGDIFLGSIDGFIKFNPKTFAENKFVPVPVVTDFLLHNKKVIVDGKDSPLEESIVFSDNITLKSRQNSFSFRVAALGYLSPQANTIMYQLENFDEDWHSVTESPLISYSNLKHGKYNFRLKVSNGDGVWSEHERNITINILPPIYLSIWAYLIYFITFIGITLYIIYQIRRRTAIKEYRAKEKFKQEKEREIYDAKIDFFTNVAHEIRTPLTLIKGPLENILNSSNIDTQTKDDLNIMNHNTDRLISLANQLLDFRKVESDSYKLDFTRCNISEILRECYIRFKSMAIHKELDFTLNLPEEDYFAHINKEAFIKIISNLFSNAIKYSKSYILGKLDVNHSTDNNYFQIFIENDGYIIPPKMKESVFKAFVRVDEFNSNATGTGIGLALSRSLAELHQGSLKIIDNDNLNIFCLTLPTIHMDVISDIPEQNSQLVVSDNTPPNKGHGRNQNKPTILVTEDDPEMLSFIVKQLSEYTVLTAFNGEEALKILDKNIISLIISDIMMPKMDGFELCQTVKSNIEYSHIPVILLTAKTNLQSKIEGLETGADLYIEKPFSVEYLKACVANLIRNREKLKESFANSPFLATNSIALTKTDENFLKRLNKIFLDNIENPDFSMDEVAEKLNMSRSSFYRKINGVLNMNPNEYIRLERLKRAAQLLREGENRINEVCYLVGFSSPSYFSKCFQKQFGMLPKDFVNENTKDD